MTVELEDLATEYGEPRKLVYPLASIDFPPVRVRKLGEVCMAIRRPNGRFLLQTKESYPQSVLRLPSGGIENGESVYAALMRETWEETNLTVTIDRFVAQISYETPNAKAEFISYLFCLREIGGRLSSNDPSERISEWAEVEPGELLDRAASLRNMTSSWGNWGMFRAAALEVLAAHCIET